MRYYVFKGIYQYRFSLRFILFSYHNEEHTEHCFFLYIHIPLVHQSCVSVCIHFYLAMMPYLDGDVKHSSLELIRFQISDHLS